MFEELQQGVREIESLQSGSPNVRSIEETGSGVRTGSFDTHYPNRQQMEDDWDHYKSFSLVRTSIRDFASTVVADGYGIDHPNESVAEELEEWLKRSSIVSGEIDKDFRTLAKKAVIQREARGTALIEKVPIEGSDDLYGFKMINPETVKIYTKPGQAVLLPPDSNIEDAERAFRQNDRDDVVRNGNGDVASYVQYDHTLSAFASSDSPEERAFSRDEIIKLTRDEDVGEVFGTSRIEAVEDRINALEKKLADNDDAISSLAYPFMLFKAGSEDDPWSEDDIDDFIEEHDAENYAPGMKQIVQGDMDVEDFSGDVAEIAEYLNFDVNMIMSEMPIPKYALGAFEHEVNQFVSRSQENEFQKQVEEARQELESEFTPVMQDKAEQMGLQNPDEVRLVFGTDPTEVVEDNPEDVPDGNEDGDNSGARGTDFTRPPASSEQESAEVVGN